MIDFYCDRQFNSMHEEFLLFDCVEHFFKTYNLHLCIFFDKIILKLTCSLNYGIKYHMLAINMQIQAPLWNASRFASLTVFENGVGKNQPPSEISSLNLRYSIHIPGKRVHSIQIFHSFLKKCFAKVCQRKFWTILWWRWCCDDKVVAVPGFFFC